MPIQYVVFRTFKGRRFDLIKTPSFAIRAGDGGIIEVSRRGTDDIRVTVNGEPGGMKNGRGLTPLGSLPTPGPHKITVDLLRDDVVTESMTFSLEVTR